VRIGANPCDKDESLFKGGGDLTLSPGYAGVSAPLPASHHRQRNLSG
jgi:hypothetical protein